jgi:putative oxidoreductase
MQNVLKEWGPLVGRVLLVLIFLPAGIGKITGFSGTAHYMASKGVPLVDLALVLTIFIEIAGPVLIILGWKARWAAGVMFLWLIPVTLMMHNFWAISDPTMHQINQIMFMKNVSIMGAMLLIAAFGTGPKSLERSA